MKKALLYALTAATVINGLSLPAAAENTEYSPIGIENMNRGLVAVSSSNGIYLSWRLNADEDTHFGTADENVSFNIYRDNELIANESQTTNYIDTEGSADSEYYVMPVINGNELDEEIQTVTPLSSGSNYFDIPLVLPEDETITDSSGNSTTYPFTVADCSTADLDGDGEYEIIVKFVSHEIDVGSAGYSGTTRFNAYKLDGTRMWEQDINLGRNVFSSAHTAQFLVYDFDGDGKAEMTVQTSLGSTDASGNYVSSVSASSSINSISDEENLNADFRTSGDGRVSSGQEFLTVFDGETGNAIDTIDYPTARVNVSCWGKSDGGNRSLRFLADVAYLDGKTPYAVYWRGYYNTNGRTGVAGVRFDGERLNVDYIFDTKSGQNGYTKGNEKYTAQGNHNITVADVDNDGKDEFISGALCFEVNDENKLVPKWCSYRQHGDALHIGDYDPTHEGYEYFSVHEDGGSTVTDDNGNEKTLDYGMTVYDAATGEELVHFSNTKDTGRGMMANVGSGGYYQITGSGTYQCNGGTDFTATSNGMGNNFRVFWDGDLYDELLNGTSITSWNGKTMAQIFNADGCVQINSTKANPSLQADILGDWREEVIYPLSDYSALRVYTSTEYTSYKIKSLMYDRVYRSGVAAEQTAYNQPPHIGFYLADDCFYGNLTDITADISDAKTEYHVGEPLDTSGLVVTANYSDSDSRQVSDYAVSGYDPSVIGAQEVTVTYLGVSASYTVNTIAESDISVECTTDSIYVGDEFTKDMLSVSLIYENGDTVPVTNFSLSDIDTLSSGIQTLTVTYEGVQRTYTKPLTLNVKTDFTANSSGKITGYNGNQEEVTLPYSITEASPRYSVTEINGSEIKLNVTDTEPTVYAAAYNSNGTLKNVKLFNLTSDGNISLDAGFDVDKVFIWKSMYPAELEESQQIKIKKLTDGSLKNSGIRRLYIYNDELTFDGDDIFPDGITIVCHDGSSAYEYAIEHNIAFEIINEGDKITFDEDFYQAYLNKNMLMQGASASSLTTDFVSYNTHAADSRAPWYTANTYGFKVAAENGNNYLYVNAGIYDQSNQFDQVYMTLTDVANDTEKQTISFDMQFPANSGSPYIELQAANETVVDTVSASSMSLTSGVWYRYELEYNGSTYTRRIYTADGTLKAETSLGSASAPILTIAFKQDFNMGSNNTKTGLTYIDNITLN